MKAKRRIKTPPQKNQKLKKKKKKRKVGIQNSERYFFSEETREKKFGPFFYVKENTGFLV